MQGDPKADENRRKKLRRREDRDRENQNIFLQSVIDGVSDPIIVVGTDLRHKLMNKAAYAFAGREPNQSEREHCYRMLFNLNKPCDSSGLPCPLVQVLESGKPVTVEHEHLCGDGTRRTFEILASPLWGEEGTFLGIIESLRDITERKRAAIMLQQAHDELELRVQERTAELVEANDALRREIEDRSWAEDELLQAKEQGELIYRLIPSAIFTVDTGRRITSWNNKAEEVTGYKREEVVGKTCEIFALKPCTMGCGLFSDYARKPILNRECEIRTKDGRVRIISKNSDLIRDTSGEVIGGVESFEDITDRKEMENILRSEHDKFRSMLTALGQGMHILNRNYDIEYQNDVLRELFGDKIGEKCYQVYKGQDEPCEICRMQEAIDSNEIRRTEVLMANGRYYEQSYGPFRDVDGQTKALILLRDITEEKAYQAETMRAGQLASIGELAAGVAHEINNPINGIINYAQILWDEGGRDEAEVDILSRIIKEGERIAEIVRNLLVFARQQDDEVEEVHLQTVVGDALSLIKHQLMKDSIEYSEELPDDLPTVRANPRQLQQVFLNLLSNARYALNQRYAGKDPDKKLQVVGCTVRIDGKNFVRITVTDYGTGIPEEIQDVIFDPFFSTKKQGEGTGLGLSISHGLIKDCNGYLRVESEVNRYTTMIVELPAFRSVTAPAEEHGEVAVEEK